MKTYAIVTGGSEGIGFAIAKELVQRGRNVVVVARSEERLANAQQALQQIAQDRFPDAARPEVLLHVTDVTDAAACIALHTRFAGQTDILVNNAGIGFRGFVSDEDFESKIKATIDTNCTALAHLSQLFLHDLHTHRGHLVNISSIVGAVPIPTYAVYAASKAFVTSFSEALRRECQLQKLHVSVLTVLPTTTETNFFHKANPGTTSNYRRVAPEALARKVVDRMLRRRPFLVHTVQSHLFLSFFRLFGWKVSSYLATVLY